MSMKAAGYTCPWCGYDKEMDIIKLLKDDDGHPIGVDLECPLDRFQWQEINWE